MLAAAEKLSEAGNEKSADLVRSQTNADRYLEAAKDAKEGLGAEWASFLKAQIDFDKEVVDPSTLALPRALWDLADPVVVTTNYDRVLKLAHPDPANLDIWDIEAPAEQSALLRGNESLSTLWYLHGLIGNAANIILTPNGYERLYGSDNSEAEFTAARATLQSLLTSHTFLFVGFSFNDPALGAELRAFDAVMKKSGGPHYAIVREGDVDRLRALDLPVEPISVADYGQPLVDAIQELAAIPRDGSLSITSPSPAANTASVADFSPNYPAFFIPYRAKGDGVIGRAKALAAVRAQLEAGKQTSIGQTAAFKGLGGLGKTQLAVEYATTYRADYPSGVVWLTADQEIAPQLIEIAEDARWVSPQSEHRYKLDIALHRLRTFDGGLVIFDNVERYEDIVPYLPLPSASPHLLLTSRGEIPHFIPIPLSVLTPDDGYRLLLQEAGRSPEGREAEFAHRIADRLDGLPLALELAGAYLQHRNIPFEDYHALLDRNLPEVLANRLLTSFTKHDADLASTLAVHEHILEEAPALQDVLRVFTWSASSAMSVSLMRAILLDHSDLDIQQALDLGEALRLLTLVPGTRRYAIHRLVAEVRRAQDMPSSEWTLAAAQRVAAWFRERRSDFESLGAYELDFDHLDAWGERP